MDRFSRAQAEELSSQGVVDLVRARNLKQGWHWCWVDPLTGRTWDIDHLHDVTDAEIANEMRDQWRIEMEESVRHDKR